MRRTALAVLLTAPLGMAGCASYAPVSPAFQQSIDAPYNLGSGDRVRVTVFGEDGLSNVYAVDKAGYVAFPLVGPVPARGRTPRELEAAIAAKLRGGYLNDPDVSVQVEQYRPFYIMGEVAAGGQYTYVPGMTVQNAVAIAGGYTPRAQQKTVDITRSVGGRILTGRVLASDLVLPGDTLYIRERLF
ncbi:polysaccharide biosynthesis/export family protein [Aurantimonas sp. Leaf443]|uniref:polysaccharide biosynthesis/export family protein n=1 Tax=Aurantimonas sp. Leaf443 TaxID=1736378 RepID=UPI0006F2C17C|nr:polysaccharide biosynthesis/export family protein [Aurantimonas sp. Leaf443]KQT86316.1 sugar ABC transporter substrate-binding protein [Aurantimonas sp. Leaf443]